jgi:hypothetical protein
VHEQLELLPVAWRRLYLDEALKAAAKGDMDVLLPDVRPALHVLGRHMGHARIALDEEQKEHDLAVNSTPAAAAANAPQVAASCGLTCPVSTVEAVPLVIEVLQLLATMAEQPDRCPQYDSLDAYRHGALLLHSQLVMLQCCPALCERRSSAVQQSAQQIMQLLRWQLQLAAQRSTPPHGEDASDWEKFVDGVIDQAEQTLFVVHPDPRSGV